MGCISKVPFLLATRHEAPFPRDHNILIVLRAAKAFHNHEKGASLVEDLPVLST